MFILTTSVLLSSSPVSPLERDGARSPLDKEQGAYCETSPMSRPGTGATSAAAAASYVPITDIDCLTLDQH